VVSFELEPDTDEYTASPAPLPDAQGVQLLITATDLVACGLPPSFFENTEVDNGLAITMPMYGATGADARYTVHDVHVSAVHSGSVGQLAGLATHAPLDAAHTVLPDQLARVQEQIPLAAAEAYAEGAAAAHAEDEVTFVQLDAAHGELRQEAEAAVQQLEFELAGTRQQFQEVQGELRALQERNARLEAEEEQLAQRGRDVEQENRRLEAALQEERNARNLNETDTQAALRAARARADAEHEEKQRELEQARRRLEEAQREAREEHARLHTGPAWDTAVPGVGRSVWS